MSESPGTRKDFYKNAIIKKSKAHKVTWADKVKNGKLESISKIENYTNFNTQLLNEPQKKFKENNA